MAVFSMAVFSLVLLVLAIFLGFFRKMNTGLIAFAFALLLGKMAGIADKEIIKGFNYSLFIMLLGVTYLFSLAQMNGCLELLAKKVVAMAGKRTWLIPIIIYLFSTVLSAIGPGTVPTMAIMMVFAMALAAEMNINPAMLSALSVLGASGGGVSPLASTGIIGINLCAGFGVTGTEIPFLVNGILSSTVYGTVVYFICGGYKLHSSGETSLNDLPTFNKNQIITLVGIAVLVFVVMVLKINVGLAAFGVAAVLSLLRVADETKAILRIPWGTLLLITGVGVLMNMIIKVGGIALLADLLASVMTERTAMTVLGLTSGIMSWFSSTSGVVMPTLLPVIPDIIARIGGDLNPIEMATGITMMSNTAGISPLSTGGALALAAYSSAANSNPEEQQSLFLRMFGISALGVVVLAFLAYFGLYRWLL